MDYLLFSLNMFLPADGRTDISMAPDALKLVNDVIGNSKFTKYNVGPYRIDLLNQTNILCCLGQKSPQLLILLLKSSMQNLLQVKLM